MGTPGSVARQIQQVEGFAVRFADEAGSRRRLEDYPYERAAKGSFSVSEFRRKRLEATYPDEAIEVLHPDGSAVHGRTLLQNLRTEYADAPADASNAFDAPADASPPTPTTKPRKSAKQPKNDAAPRKLEATLWEAADKLRGNLEASEYKHVVLGLVFLKYVSDAFDTRHAELAATLGDPQSPDYIPNEQRRAQILESRDEYVGSNVFWVPPDARWQRIVEAAKLPTIGVAIDGAMDAIERENPSLKGVLPKTYARAEIDKRRLGELIDVFSKDLGFTEVDHGADDVLGRIYEYFLGAFAGNQGKAGGEFYTPPSIVRVLVEMLEPLEGDVYDPCCGSGGMFVQSGTFVKAHQGRIDDLKIYGQERTHSTWRLARMNLAIRRMECKIHWNSEGTLLNDGFPDERFDFVLANPPFNVSDWSGERLRDDVRWQFGVPPVGNANFAWLQHIVHHLGPNGFAGVVLANGSMSGMSSGEGEIRKALIEGKRASEPNIDGGVVDCMISLPTQMFFGTQIPACLWILSKDRSNGIARDQRLRDRRDEILFIDARKMGHLESRTFRVFSDDEISKIASTYHAWRGESGPDEYADVAGFCRSTPISEVRKSDYILTPGRYVGAAETDISDDPFEVRFMGLKEALLEQFDEADEISALVRTKLELFDYGS